MWQEYMDLLHQRAAEARAAVREEEGRCGTCGAFQGPNHICPHIQQLRNQVRKPFPVPCDDCGAGVGEPCQTGCPSQDSNPNK